MLPPKSISMSEQSSKSFPPIYVEYKSEEPVGSNLKTTTSPSPPLYVLSYASKVLGKFEELVYPAT